MAGDIHLRPHTDDGRLLSLLQSQELESRVKRPYRTPAVPIVPFADGVPNKKGIDQSCIQVNKRRIKGKSVRILKMAGGFVVINKILHETVKIICRMVSLLILRALSLTKNLSCAQRDRKTLDYQVT